MKLKKRIIIPLIITVCTAAIILSLAIAAKDKQEFEIAAGGLYYLFWCKGEESADLARERFQKDFDLTDKDMGDLSRLSAEYYFAQSDLSYAAQNGQDDALDKLSGISADYMESVGKIIKDEDKLIQWMSDFNNQESTIGN